MAKATVVAADEGSRIANMEVRPIACWSKCTCTCDMFANMKMYLVVCSLQKMLAVLYEKLHEQRRRWHAVRRETDLERRQDQEAHGWPGRVGGTPRPSSYQDVVHVDCCVHCRTSSETRSRSGGSRSWGWCRSSRSTRSSKRIGSSRSAWQVFAKQPALTLARRRCAFFMFANMKITFTNPTHVHVDEHFGHVHKHEF